LEHLHIQFELLQHCFQFLLEHVLHHVPPVSEVLCLHLQCISPKIQQRIVMVKVDHA
jgi:hypothetical protein